VLFYVHKKRPKTIRLFSWTEEVINNRNWKYDTLFIMTMLRSRFSAFYHFTFHFTTHVYNFQFERTVFKTDFYGQPATVKNDKETFWKKWSKYCYSISKVFSNHRHQSRNLYKFLVSIGICGAKINDFNHINIVRENKIKFEKGQGSISPTYLRADFTCIVPKSVRVSQVIRIFLRFWGLRA